MVLLYCITSFSPLFPDGTGSNSGVTLYVEPGHMWLSKKADGGTILGRGEIPKLALCWLGRQPGRDIYTERRVNVCRHMSWHLRRREQPVRNTHLGHPVMSPNKPNHYYHRKPTNYTAFTKDICHNRGKQILAKVLQNTSRHSKIWNWNFPRDNRKVNSF